MDIKDVVKSVEASKNFKDLIKKDSGHYLVHIFKMMDAEKTNDWQIGYYSKKTDKVTVFEYDDGKIKTTEPQEAFKDKKSIPQLYIDKVKISQKDAMKIVDKVVKENYSAESLVKAIVLLQNLIDFGLIWNITLITQTFNVLNIKVDAASGKVIKHTKESLMGWNKK